MDADGILEAIDYGARECDFTQRYWTLDPVDGTKGFLRHDQYVVALALIEHGRPVLGVLGCPNLPCDLRSPEQGKGCLLTAVKGLPFQIIDGLIHIGATAIKFGSMNMTD